MSNESLKGQAYQIIRQKILDCEFKPGTLLNESYLCQLLSISRTPVRDALSRLEQERLLRIIQPKGILIETITLSDFNSYFETRLFLEPYITKTYGDRLPEAEIKGFLQSCQNSAASADEFYAFAASLHNFIIKNSENPYFLQIYEQLSSHEQRINKLFPISSEEIQSLSAQYELFLEYLLAQDWPLASGTLEQILITLKDCIFPGFLLLYTKDSHSEVRHE